ncbi:MAG: hypothetical protein IT210_17185 [Armatimonadetes bacterium]|nr:hypothetical protein [Armatimonadota bacterium]
MERLPENFSKAVLPQSLGSSRIQTDEDNLMEGGMKNMIPQRLIYLSLYAIIVLFLSRQVFADSSLFLIDKEQLTSIKVTVRLNASKGLIDNLVELSAKTELNLATSLSNLKTSQSASLAFEQKPLSEVLDQLAKAYHVRWRLVNTRGGKGAAFILFEEQKPGDDKNRLAKLKEEISDKTKAQGWKLPNSPGDGTGFGSRTLLDCNRKAQEFLRNLSESLDTVTLNRLSSDGIPFGQLPSNLQQSIRALVEESNRAHAFATAEDILYYLLKK